MSLFKVIKEKLKRENGYYYDYLTLEIKKGEELEKIINFILRENVNFDFCFLLNRRFKGKKLYVRISGELEKKEILKENLKKLHNFYRISFNRNFSFKKVSKHSVFFEGKNYILNFKENDFQKKELSCLYKELKGVFLCSLDFKEICFSEESDEYL